MKNKILKIIGIAGAVSLLGFLVFGLVDVSLFMTGVFAVGENIVNGIATTLGVLYFVFAIGFNVLKNVHIAYWQ